MSSNYKCHYYTPSWFHFTLENWEYLIFQDYYILIVGRTSVVLMKIEALVSVKSPIQVVLILLMRVLTSLTSADLFNAILSDTGLAFLQNRCFYLIGNSTVLVQNRLFSIVFQVNNPLVFLPTLTWIIPTLMMPVSFWREFHWALKHIKRAVLLMLNQCARKIEN